MSSLLIGHLRCKAIRPLRHETSNNSPRKFIQLAFVMLNHEQDAAERNIPFTEGYRPDKHAYAANYFTVLWQSRILPLSRYPCSHRQLKTLNLSIRFSDLQVSCLITFYPHSTPQNVAFIAFSATFVARGRYQTREYDSGTRGRAAARSCSCISKPLAHNLRSQRHATTREEARI